MPGEEVYLPEDPFTSFYVNEEETKRAVNGEELPENNKSKSNGLTGEETFHRKKHHIIFHQQMIPALLHWMIVKKNTDCQLPLLHPLESLTAKKRMKKEV